MARSQPKRLPTTCDPDESRASVLHIVGDSEYGGGSVVVRDIAVAAKASGLDVHVLATNETFVRRLVSCKAEGATNRAISHRLPR